MPINCVSLGEVHRHPLWIAEAVCILTRHPAENAAVCR